MEQAAAAISEALRRAEIPNHRQLGEAIAPLVVDVLHGETGGSDDGKGPTRAGPLRLAQMESMLMRRVSALLSSSPRNAREPAPRPKLSRILALERSSFRVIATWRAEGLSTEPTSNLVAATKQFALREFASPHDELRVLNLLGGRVLLRASARLIVAGQFLGEPHPDDKARLDNALKSLIKNEHTPSDADLARVAARLATPDAPVVTRKRVMIGLGVLLACCAGLALALRSEGWDARLRKIAAAAQREQPQLSGWPLTLSIDRENHLATLNGVAPADADLDALARALPDSPPYRWELHVAQVATADALRAAESRILQKTSALGEQVQRAQDQLQALDQRLDRTEKWQAERAAEAEKPTARLAHLAQNTVILFRDDDNFLDDDLAHRQLTELAARLKETDARLRIIGYTDAHGSAPKNIALSRDRAAAVIDVLLALGIDARRLIAVGRADQAPIAPEDSADRRRNRRVTFELLGAAETAR